MSHVVALCGGVGGAKLALGLARTLPEGALTIVVNAGDDFEHLGLSISPDIDTVLYTLAGLADPVRGWGRADESWSFMAALRSLGGEDWFQLGDRDLALHVERTRRRAAGETLSEITAAIAGRLDIRAAIAPMSDDPVRTILHTAAGVLAFQDYFVRLRCGPCVEAITFEGIEKARMSNGFAEALGRDDLAAVIICPSNPYLSIDPILAIPGVRAALKGVAAPRVAVSPIVEGAAVKGPTAKLMQELGVATEPASIAAHYRGLIDCLVIDTADRAHTSRVEANGLVCTAAPTIMRNDSDKVLLARFILEQLIPELRPRPKAR